MSRIRKRQFCLRLPPRLLLAVDEAAMLMEKTRTAFIEEALREALRRALVRVREPEPVQETLR